MGKKKIKIDNKHINRNNLDFKKVNDKVNANFFSSTNRNLQRLILFLLSFIIYSATINFDFTLDDTLMITQNSYTKQGIKGIKEIMTNDALVGFLGKGKNLLPGGRYRPLSHVLFAVEYELLGLSKLEKVSNLTNEQKIFKEKREKLMKIIGHSVNVILYSLLSLLIFSVLLRMFKLYEKPQWYASISFIATLLFIVHPLHTEVVCNIKNVDEIMSMLGSMSVLWFLFKYYDTKKNWLLVFPIIIYPLAILSKEDSLTFIAIFPLTLFVFTNVDFKQHLKMLIPPIIGMIIYFIIRYNALGFIFSNSVVNTELLNNPFVNASNEQKIATILYTWLIYFKLLFFPHPLTHDYYPYHINIVNFNNLWVWVSLLIWVILIIYSIINIKKKNIIAYGILFYLITFSISSNLVFNIGAFMNERFVFISLLGFTIIISFLIIKKISYFLSKGMIYPIKIISILLIIVSLIFSIKSFARSFTWKDDYTLFTTDVKTSKNSAKCNVSAGGMIYHKALQETNINKRNKMFQEAINYLKKGVEIYPGYVAGILELGNVYLDYQKYSEAKACYERVLKFNSKHPNALNNMLALAQRVALDSNYSYSNEVYFSLLRYEPNKIDYLFSIAANMVELKKLDTAILILQDIIKKDSNYYKAYSKLGEIYGRYLNNLNLSEQYLLKAYSLNTNDASVLENLGIVYGIKGQFEKSLYFFNQALIYDPDNARIFMNIAGTYTQMKQSDKAMEYIQKAETLRKKVKN